MLAADAMHMLNRCAGAHACCYRYMPRQRLDLIGFQILTTDSPVANVLTLAVPCRHFPASCSTVLAVRYLDSPSSPS
jgi:hypothetical protein